MRQAIKTMVRPIRSLLPASTWDIVLDFITYVANHIACNIPSHRFRLFFYRKIMRWKIGNQSHIHERLKFHGVPGGGLTIGNNVSIGQDAFIGGPGYSGGDLTIGNNVSIAMQAFIVTGGHKTGTQENFDLCMRSVTIEDHVVIFARASIIACNIGRGAVIMPGAVVVKDVEPFTIMGGVPAKPIGMREPQQDPNYLINWCWRFH